MEDFEVGPPEPFVVPFANYAIDWRFGGSEGTWIEPEAGTYEITLDSDGVVGFVKVEDTA